MDGVSPAQKLKVFISYSRRDMPFADRLVAALDARGFEVMIDRRDLPKLEDWERELLGFIRRADTVIFVVSPHSIASKACAWEVEQVRANAKRLAPVVIADVEGMPIPREISRINYLYFTDEAVFEARADELASALNTDVPWLREHTRLGELARRWLERGRPAEALIRGRDLDDADAWAARRPHEAPVVSEAHRAFLTASRTAQTERLHQEQEQVTRTKQFQRRAAWGLSGVFLLVILGAFATAWEARRTSAREALIFLSAAEVAFREGYCDRALRLAVAGLPPPGATPLVSVRLPQLQVALARYASDCRFERQLKGHSGRVESVAFDPTGNRVLSASADGTALLWNSASGQLLKRLFTDRAHLRSAAFNPSGTLILTSSDDKTARIWGAEVGDVKQVLSHPQSVVLAKFSPDGTRVLSVSSDRLARIWDPSTGELIAVLSGHEGFISSAEYSPDGRLIVTASDDTTARVWEATSGTLLHILRGHTQRVASAQFNQLGTKILTSSEDKTARVWDALQGTAIGVCADGHEDFVNDARFSSDETIVATASSDKSARLWKAGCHGPIAKLEGHSGFVQSVEFSPDGRTILTHSGDGSARVWDVALGIELFALKGDETQLTAATFGPDGSHIVTASGDGTVRLWVVQRAQVAELRGHRDFLRSARFSHDGAHVVTSSGDHTARIWDARTGSLVLSLKGHTSELSDARFNGKDRLVVTASRDRTAQIWDAQSGDRLTVLEGHERTVTTASFSPDDKYLLTASLDGTTRTLGC